MARRTTPLTARQVATAKAGVYGDGDGLFLVVKESGARSWEVRYALPGAKRRAMGIGAVDRPYSLAEARERAREVQKQAKNGIDPLAEKQQHKAAEVAKSGAATFRHCAEAFIRSRKTTWKSAAHAREWPASLNRYVYPALGDKQVQDITALDVLAVLQPIWLTIPETASRIRNRIELAIDWAIAMDHRTHADNPARWAGKLRMLLPSPTKAKDAARRQAGRAEHHPALPWQEMPEFMAALRVKEAPGARALEFNILTAARTGETVGALWSEINFETRVWTVPAIRMKAGKEHAVPLSNAAMAVLAIQQEYGKYIESPFIFPGRDEPSTSSMHRETLRQVLNTIREDITVHGFRSTFRQWAADTGRSDAAAEMALAHTLGKVQAAYQRSNLLEERRLLAEAWAIHTSGEDTASVIPFPTRAVQA